MLLGGSPHLACGMRVGLTLVEVLVALLLFELGMLALTGVAAVASRDLASAKLTARAHALARNRVEALRSAPCPQPAFGLTAEHGTTERWRVSADHIARRIVDSVEFALPSGRVRYVVREAWVPCS